MSNPFELGKKYDKRNTRNNTRGQNIAAGAAGGVAVNAVGGAALGGAVGAHAARSGLRDLKAVGAAPSKVGAARIVTGHAARTGGKTALGLGTLGLLAGTAHGAMVGAKRRKPVRKNARRMDPAPATARFAGALPKHSPEAQAVAQAAATKRKPPVAAAIRGTLRATTIAKGDPFQPVAKANADRRGQTAALAGGAVVSHAAGAELRNHAVTHLTAAHEGGGLTPYGQKVYRAKATKQLKGSRAAAAGAAALTAGAVLNSQRKRSGAVSKSALGVESESPFQPAVVTKGAFGERGDKRNTKYAAAGYAGATAGSIAGRRAGAKAAGTSMRGIYTQAVGHHLAAADMGIPPERGVLRSGFKALKGVHGSRSMLVGDGIGSVAGAAAGAAAVHHRRARRGVAKSAFEPVAKKKIPAVLPGEKVASRGFEPKKLPARSVRDAGGRGAQGQRRAVRSGKV